MSKIMTKKKTIIMPLELQRTLEKKNGEKTLWWRGSYGTWFHRTGNEMEVSEKTSKIELFLKGITQKLVFVWKESKTKKSHEKTFLLKKTTTELQNIITGTCTGCKKKLRLRSVPEPSRWLCKDRRPNFEVDGSRTGNIMEYSDKQKREQSITYLAGVFVHTGVHDKKKKVEKIRQDLLWDFKTQRYIIRKKEKLTKHAYRQLRVQIRSKSLISLGAFVSQLRNKKRPNFYTGKGIRYYKDIIPNRLERKLYVKEVRKKEKVSRASRTMGKRPNIWAY